MKYLLPVLTLISGLGVVLAQDHAIPKPPHAPVVVAQDITLSPDKVTNAIQGERRDWGHTNLDLEAAQKLATGKGVLVAVIDTGVDVDHVDLKGAVVESKDFTNSRSGSADVQGHGTHCAGIIGARKNDVGIVGAAYECGILNLKCLGDNGSGSDTGIADAIDYAVSKKVHVISGSLGADQPSQRIVDAVNRALKAGIICVFAAGNSGPGEGTVGWPGAMPGVICVAATDKGDTVAQFSSRGRQVLIAAPGVQIDSTYPGGRYALLSGTSMATPYVSGIAALYVERCQSAGIKYDYATFAKALQDTARDLDPPGKDTATGFGLVQPVKLLESIKGDTPAPPVVGKGFTGTITYVYRDGLLVEIKR
jgi:subtilisin